MDQTIEAHLPIFSVRKPSQRGTGNETLPGKALGDDPAQPTTQRLGAFAMETTAREVEAFTQLARGYIFEGNDRRSVCIKNAQVRQLIARSTHEYLRL